MAVDAGADAVGFVFAPSSRQVNAAQVAAMTRGLPRTVEKVGVFTTRDAEEIVAAARFTGLDAVQLHGGGGLELAGAITAKMPELGVLLTLSWPVDGGEAEEQDAARRLAELAESGCRLLVDTKVRGSSGGTGVRFDWTRARGVLRGAAGVRLVVAGGLTPGNVGEAVRVLAPWGVDVASGVETRPGVKDRGKVVEFVRAAHRN